MSEVNLGLFSTGDYKAGPRLKVVTWYFVNYLIFNSSLPWPYIIKRKLLRFYGSKIGNGVIIKPKVRIKNPWRLSIGDNCWIGESVWIDNLENITIGNNVCISQGAMLLTGNHDYSDISFPYRLGRISIEDGVWIGAKSVVCPGVKCKFNSILTVNSVATKNLETNMIYSGNPSIAVRERKLKSGIAQ